MALRDIWAADAARDIGDWGGAARSYCRALAKAPRLAHIWVQYGHMLREDGQGDLARDAYERAISLQPEMRDPYRLLIRLARAAGDRASVLRHSLANFRLDQSDPGSQILLLQALSAEEPGHVEPIGEVAVTIGRTAYVGVEAAGHSTIYFDIGDLIAHFSHSRLPSGLQRVEIEVTRAALAVANSVPLLCCWSMAAGAWKPLAPAMFFALVDAASSNIDTAGWHQQLTSVLYSLVIAPTVVFPAASTLLNLGMAWGDPTYYPAVAREKARCGLRFASIACDVIPLARPNEVPYDIVAACGEWLDSLASVADSVIAISEATREDIVKVSSARSRPIPRERISVVPLDAMFTSAKSNGTDALVRNGLRRGSYALYVSTVEPRKNHLAAFAAWRILAANHTLRTPDLVCVGRMGWRSETVVAVLAADRELASRIHMLADVSDMALGELYEGCAFVFYPSLQEGWGLPVTEALAHGKVPVVGRNSSLVEAGGSFAICVDESSPADMAAAITMLIDDSAALAAREQAIRDGFRPRSWITIAEEMIAVAAGSREDDLPIPGQS